ncbi:FAD-binding protein [Microbacterium sp.]|uniref:FAD-binding protein n=1 Tax=Microbacterium sp. TaxID=51671 RepID=UPI002811E366|nr:FAD-binding protein [Microbacterium sp.]
MSSTTNWAGNLTYGARRIARPASVDELREVIASARREGLRVRTLGSRHSFTPIADTEGVLVESAGLAGAIDILDDERDAAVRVAGGIRYGELASELHRRGYALATLASLPHISVAGAVATGTHGSGDRTGSLAAAVRAITLLTADGEHRRLARGEDGFDGAVISLGALGVVTQLELDVEPTYDVAQSVHEGPRWDALLAEFDAVTSLGTSVSIFSRWTDADIADQLWIKNRVGAEPADAELLARLGAAEASVARHPIFGAPAEACTEQFGRPGPWHARLPHFRLEFTPSAGEEIQSEYLVPRADAVAAIEAIRSLADRIAPLLLVTEIRTVAADRLWLSSSYDSDAVGIHFTWTRDEAAVRALLPDIEAALPASARPHWGKIFTLPGEEVRRRYPRWDDVAALRDRMDPERVFMNGFLEGLGL